MNAHAGMMKEDCLRRPDLYPWAADMPDGSFVSTAFSWPQGDYLDLFEEHTFPSGKETFGDIRYFVFDPTKHGSPADGVYPVVLALHGSGGSFVGKTAASWAGAERLASPEWQRALGGCYVIVPLANECRDTAGDTRQSWMTPVPGRPFNGFSDEEMASGTLRESWGPLLGNDSVYTPALLSLTETECARRAVRGRRIVFGTSAGGYGAWRLILSRPGFFDAALIMAGAYRPSIRELDTLEEAGTKLFICHGKRDELVPFDTAMAPVLPRLARMPGFEGWFPDFVRRADGGVASNVSGVQMGQHCINDVVQEDLTYCDGTPMDPAHPDGTLGWLRRVLRG